MKILMVLANRDFPPDIRVEKEARALQQIAEKVIVLCASDGSRPSQQFWEGINILRVPKQGYLPLRLNLLQLALTFHSSFWKQQITQVAVREQIDVIHVHDLPMLGTGLSVSKSLGIPLIADLHENYPAAIQYYQSGGSLAMRWMRKLALNYQRWQAYEYRSCLRADHVLVVVEEARERLMQQGVSGGKISVIENTEDIAYFTGLGIDAKLVAQYRDKFMITYIGGFGGQHRGLDIAIQAMPEVVNSNPESLLLLIGNGPIKPMLQDMVRNLDLIHHVKFVEWQPFEKIPSYIELSDICLVPHRSNPHTEATSPHKLFQYMLMGKPVVVSSCKPLRRIVEETACGLVFESDNSSSLAEAITQLKDKALRNRLGQSGKIATIQKYNWSKTSKDLIAVYERLATH